jgi:hypothetical protein
VFDLLSPIVLLLLATGWVWSLANAKTLARADGDVTPFAQARALIANALPTSDAPATAYLTDAALTSVRSAPPACAQYLPPVFKGPGLPPQTIISLPVHTAV